MKKFISYFLASSVLFINNTSYAEDFVSNVSDRYVYFGTEFGLSDPIIKSFKHEESKTKMRLKKSHMYGGRIGYSFYPNMMLEISGTHQPKYRLAYILPEQELAPGFSTPEIPGITGVSSNVFTMNFIYEMEKMTSFAIKPYAIFGAGVAKTSMKPTISYFNNMPVFKIKKNNQNCFAWQVGVGVAKDLTQNFTIDFGAKMQVVKDIKIKYKVLNMQTHFFDEAEPIKKTISVGEFTVGLTYKFPLSR